MAEVRHVSDAPDRVRGWIARTVGRPDLPVEELGAAGPVQDGEHLRLVVWALTGETSAAARELVAGTPERLDVIVFHAARSSAPLDELLAAAESAGLHLRRVRATARTSDGPGTVLVVELRRRPHPPLERLGVALQLAELTQLLRRPSLPAVRVATDDPVVLGDLGHLRYGFAAHERWGDDEELLRRSSPRLLLLRRPPEDGPLAEDHVVVPLDDELRAWVRGLALVDAAADRPWSATGRTATLVAGSPADRWPEAVAVLAGGDALAPLAVDEPLLARLPDGARAAFAGPSEDLPATERAARQWRTLLAALADGRGWRALGAAHGLGDRSVAAEVWVVAVPGTATTDGSPDPPLDAGPARVTWTRGLAAGSGAAEAPSAADADGEERPRRPRPTWVAGVDPSVLEAGELAAAVRHADATGNDVLVASEGTAGGVRWVVRGELLEDEEQPRIAEGRLPFAALRERGAAVASLPGRTVPVGAGAPRGGNVT